MKLITAPEDFHNWNDIGSKKDRPKVFLAGGGGSFDWRSDVINNTSHLEGMILNPWRNDWPTEPRALLEQLEWEREAMAAADIMAFWFEGPSDCPISLFELGGTLARSYYARGSAGYQALVVGFAPTFKLGKDLKVRLTMLDRPFADQYGCFLDDLKAIIKSFPYLRREI